MRNHRIHHILPRLFALLVFLSGCITSWQKNDKDMVVYGPALSPKNNEAHHPLPSQCASGCDITPPALRIGLTSDEVRKEIERYAQSVPEESNHALYVLLFYSDDTRFYLSQSSSTPMHNKQRSRLEEEILVAEAIIEMRIVDENKVLRAHLLQTRVPLGQKQHLRLKHERLPGLVASGSVLRVGRDYLWTRI